MEMEEFNGFRQGSNCQNFCNFEVSLSCITTTSHLKSSRVRIKSFMILYGKARTKFNDGH